MLELFLSNGGTSLYSVFGGSNTSLYIVLVIILLVIARRIYKARMGTKFKSRYVYVIPILYLILTILSLFAFVPTVLDVLSTVLAIVIGVSIGLKLGGGVTFFEKNNQVYYKRSPFILLFWLVSFVIRITIDIFIPSNFYLNLIVIILLAGSTGLIIGEAYHISKAYHKHLNKKSK
jgi:hypothetical protein